MFFQKYLLSYGTEHHQFFDLLEGMLEYEPSNRISSSSVLCHPFFLPLIHPRRSQIWRSSGDMSRWPWTTRTSSHTGLLVSFSTDHCNVCFMLHFNPEMLIDRALYWYVQIKTLFIVNLQTKYEKNSHWTFAQSYYNSTDTIICKNKTQQYPLLSYIFFLGKENKVNFPEQPKKHTVLNGL